MELREFGILQIGMPSGEIVRRPRLSAWFGAMHLDQRCRGDEVEEVVGDASLLHLVLRGTYWQDRYRYPIEFIEATPGSGLCQSTIYLTHCSEIHLVRAIKDVTLHAQCTCKIFGGFRLSSAYITPCNVIVHVLGQWVFGKQQSDGFVPAGPAGAPPRMSFCACVNVI